MRGRSVEVHAWPANILGGAMGTACVLASQHYTGGRLTGNDWAMGISTNILNLKESLAYG